MKILKSSIIVFLLALIFNGEMIVANSECVVEKPMSFKDIGGKLKYTFTDDKELRLDLSFEDGTSEYNVVSGELLYGVKNSDSLGIDVGKVEYKLRTEIYFITHESSKSAEIFIETDFPDLAIIISLEKKCTKGQFNYCTPDIILPVKYSQIDEGESFGEF